MSEKEIYDQLSLYTLSHGDSKFIHQHIVDAYTAQHAKENSKPITTTFALVGLYLSLEKKYSGKQVQQAHIQLGRKKKEWPHFTPLQKTNDFDVFDAMRAHPGVDRDEAIMKWCSSVWDTWSEAHQKIKDLVRTELGVS